MGKKGHRSVQAAADSKPFEPAPPSKETNKYIRKLKEHLLQPSNKLYGGMGYAKESVFLQLDDPDYDTRFGDIWEEHVPGFSGKSFKKRKSASEDGMLWKKRLKLKQASAQQQLGKATGNSKDGEGQVKPLKHRNKDGSEQRPSSGAITQHIEPMSKKKAAPQQEQTAQLQSEAIRMYRQLKKARRLRT